VHSLLGVGGIELWCKRGEPVGEFDCSVVYFVICCAWRGSLGLQSLDISG